MTKSNYIHKNQIFDITRHFNGTLHFISCLRKDIIKGASATRVKPSAAGTEYTQNIHIYTLNIHSFTPNKMPRKSIK